MKKIIKNRESGVTLIALVVTIIILLILASVITYSGIDAYKDSLEKKALTELDMMQHVVLENYTKYIMIKDLDKEKALSYFVGEQVDFDDVKELANEVSIDLKDTGNYYKISESEHFEKLGLDNFKGKTYIVNYFTGEVMTIEKDEDNSNEEFIDITRTGKVLYKYALEAGDGTSTPGESADIGDILKPNPENTPDEATTVTTEWGRIDVIWLSGTTNTPTMAPNAPKLGTGMSKVTWSKTSDGTGWTEDGTAKTTWYNYTAGTGSNDNLESQWANAKTEDGSYFVWIPRYAYRITYYGNETDYNNQENPTGYYDGYGMWNAETGDVKYKLDTGVEYTTYKGNRYIVHPAFETNLDNGGWDTDLTGFWMAKYEMSREDSTDGTTWAPTTVSYGGNNNLTTNAGNTSTTKIRVVSKPGVTSWRNINIGNMYLNSYNYNRTLDSHLIKNSEWGAVAYLTHSQYGRNGKEIDVNNSSNYITGNGGGSTSASSASGVTNAYNTVTGAKASTTGNIYGIYDMSGGAYEYTASFDKLGDSSYVANSSSGLKMTENAKDGSGNYISTKYITTYSNGTSTSSGSLIYSVGKIGDSTKEVYAGSSYYNWYPNRDYSHFVGSSGPFFIRGGYYDGGSLAGVFDSSYGLGYGDNDLSFRLALVL